MSPLPSTSKPTMRTVGGHSVARGTEFKAEGHIQAWTGGGPPPSRIHNKYGCWEHAAGDTVHRPSHRATSPDHRTTIHRSTSTHHTLLHHTTLEGAAPPGTELGLGQPRLWLGRGLEMARNSLAHETETRRN